MHHLKLLFEENCQLRSCRVVVQTEKVDGFRHIVMAHRRTRWWYETSRKHAGEWINRLELTSWNIIVPFHSLEIFIHRIRPRLYDMKGFVVLVCSK